MLWAPTAASHKGQVGKLEKSVAGSLYNGGVLTKIYLKRQRQSLSKSEGMITQLKFTFTLIPEALFTWKSWQIEA